MTLKDILELVRAGYTRADIDAMTAAPAAAPAEAPAAPAPAAPEVPAAPAAPVQEDPAGLDTLLHQLLESVDGLRSTVQASQVLTGVQSAPAQTVQQGSLAATAKIINPYNHDK